MFDLIVELYDHWVHSHRSAEAMICKNVLGASSNAANVFLYTDTPMRLCGKLTIASCDNVNHGYSLAEGQYKRECIFRKYLQSSEKRFQWVLSIEQDTFFQFSTIAKFMNTLPLSNQPVYMAPVIGAFIVSTRTCIERTFNDYDYDRCKHGMYNSRRNPAGRYKTAMYNNDHLIRHCFQSNCSTFKTKNAPILRFFYNTKRTIPRNSTWHVIHHVAPSSLPSILFRDFAPRQRASGFRVKLTWW